MCETSPADFAVLIVACGPWRRLLGNCGGGGSEKGDGDINNDEEEDDGWVYAVAVTQPVQSWTVLRNHHEFAVLGNTLAGALPDLPVCPVSRPMTSSSNGHGLAAMVRTRNDLQAWLSTIIMHPTARESQCVCDFLTRGANTIPPQYEAVQWTQFNTVLQHNPPPTTSGQHEQHHQHPADHHLGGSGLSSSHHHAPPMPSHSSSPNGVVYDGNLDDMEMAEMFLEDDDEDGSDVLLAHVGVDDDDEDYVPSASERYRPTDEPITDEDEMDIMQLAGEVEMVEDIGSLAQSLGASHLGRSLNLQAEMKHDQQGPQHNNAGSSSDRPLHQGLDVGGAISASLSQQLSSPSSSTTSPSTTTGGLANIMAEAAANRVGTGGSSLLAGLSDSFNQKPPQSAPRLDSFKMIKVIGKGSFGKVFLVKENKTAQIYALKVLRKDNIIKRNQVEHTKTERSVLGYVKHPFIVGMYMAFQSKDKLYFLLDYCAGGELFFHLGKLGKFPEARARFYAAEIILAIYYVHNLDIVYRDLKPENVLLDAQGHIRLTDFGLSKEGISSSSSGANSFCGTPEYLAPEILNRQGHGRAVDWWSLGALLYEMLTGLPPFYCQDRERLFEKIRKSELHYPPTVSRPAKYLLKGLLTKDPTRRLGSGQTDAEEIKIHDFFESIDWLKLSRGELSPPWQPTIRGSLDTSQFDQEFTNMPIYSPQSIQNCPLHSGFMASGGTTPNDHSNPFEGFTFTDRKFYGPSGQAQAGI